MSTAHFALFILITNFIWLRCQTCFSPEAKGRPLWSIESLTCRYSSVIVTVFLITETIKVVLSKSGLLSIMSKQCRLSFPTRKTPQQIFLLVVRQPDWPTAWTHRYWLLMLLRNCKTITGWQTLEKLVINSFLSHPWTVTELLRSVFVDLQ